MNVRLPRVLFAATLSMIVAVSGLTRFYALDRASLWLDELFTRSAALKPTLAAAVRAGSIEDMFPPLYPGLTYFAVRGPGSAEFALRLPSAVAGVLGIFVMFALGRALHSERVGLVGAALLAVHWFAVAYAQEGRPYAFLLLATMWLTLCAIRVVARVRQGASTTLAWLALGAVGLVTSYLHYIGLLFFAASAPVMAWSLRRLPRELKRCALTYVACAFAYVPWLGIVLSQIHERSAMKLPPNATALLRAVNDLCARHALVCVAVLLLALIAWRTDEQAGEKGALEIAPFGSRERAWLLALWSLAIPLGIWILSYLVVPIYTVRNNIVVLPAVILLVAGALVRIERRWLRGWPIASMACVLALGVDLVLARQYYSAKKEPFRQFVAHVLADPEHAPLWVPPDSAAYYVEQTLTLLGADPSVMHRGAVPPAAERLWVIVRMKELPVPGGYRLLERTDHEPDRRLPYPGERMTLAHFEYAAP